MLPRIRIKEPPRLLTVAVLAREVGLSPASIRYLAAQNVVRPLLVEEINRKPMRLFTEQDIQRILAHYRERGGMKVGRPHLR